MCVSVLMLDGQGGEIRAHGENAVIYGGTSHSMVRTLEDGMMKNVRGFEIFPG